MHGAVGNLLLGWRAVLRAPSFRVVGGLVLLLEATAPLLYTAFFFGTRQTRAELAASNVFLLAGLFAFVVLPPVACRLGGSASPVLGRLAPPGAECLVVSRFAGMLAGFTAAAVLLALLGALQEWLLFPSGKPRPSASPFLVVLLSMTLRQVLLGALLIAGIVLFSQLGGVLFTSLVGLVWFLLGTQKAGLLERIDPGLGRLLVSGALVWLPDFTLFQLQPRAAPNPGGTLAGQASLALYVLLFFCLNLTFAALAVRWRWTRTTT